MFVAGTVKGGVCFCVLDNDKKAGTIWEYAGDGPLSIWGRPRYEAAGVMAQILTLTFNFL